MNENFSVEYICEFNNTLRSERSDPRHKKRFGGGGYNSYEVHKRLISLMESLFYEKRMKKIIIELKKVDNEDKTG